MAPDEARSRRPLLAETRGNSPFIHCERRPPDGWSVANWVSRRVLAPTSRSTPHDGPVERSPVCWRNDVRPSMASSSSCIVKMRLFPFLASSLVPDTTGRREGAVVRSAVRGKPGQSRSTAVQPQSLRIGRIRGVRSTRSAAVNPGYPGWTTGASTCGPPRRLHRYRFVRCTPMLQRTASACPDAAEADSRIDRARPTRWCGRLGWRSAWVGPGSDPQRDCRVSRP